MRTDFKMPVKVVNGGQPGGVATLDQDGRLPSEQLPEDIDQIVSDYVDGYLEEHPIEDMVDGWLDDHPEATTTVEDGAVTVDKLASDSLALIGSKVSPGDYAPMLHAGIADALSSTYGENATFAQRTSTRNGAMEITSLLGNTVRWNQLCYTVAKTTTAKGVTFVCDGNGTFSVTNEVTESSAALFALGDNQHKVNVVQGHKYIGYGGNGNTVGLYITGIASNIQPSSVYTANQTNATAINVYVDPSFDGNTYSAKAMLFDLTAMFGAGNEPTSRAEFEAQYPEDYYAYDAGSLQSVNIEGIETVGFNQWDEVWESGAIKSTDGTNTTDANKVRSKNFIPVIGGKTYYFKTSFSSVSATVYYYASDGSYLRYGSWLSNSSKTIDADAQYMRFAFGSSQSPITSIPANSICINISDPSRNGTYEPYTTHTLEIPASTYFPNGLRGAGTAHDALYRDHADTVIGAVDLGSLTWSHVANSDSTYRYYTTDVSSSIKSVATDYVIGNLKTINYVARAVSGVDGVARSNTGIAVNPQGYIIMYDADKATLSDDAFKAAMSGVMLYYELATPTTTTIDPPLNLTYPVEQGGTESIIVPTGATSTAPTFVTLYAYDADGIIDKTQSIVAQVEHGTASTNYAVNSYLVMRGTLYRVTSAIATGETITPGTNCTATTVMAEIIRLTA